NKLHDYAQKLRENKTEVDALYQDLLISVTNFFRDPDMYQALTTKILPALFKNKKAITTSIQLFATDLNEKAIEKARTGLYSKTALQNVSVPRLRRFFVKNDG